jgi:hypothetical protein
MPGEQDAAAIYARVCLARYGGKASRVVNDRINQLKRIGDRGGVEAWSEVAVQLSKIRKIHPNRPHSRRH